MSQHTSQIEGVINQNLKTSISQKFPNRSFGVIHQNDGIFISHIAAHTIIMCFTPRHLMFRNTFTLNSEVHFQINRMVNKLCIAINRMLKPGSETSSYC